MLLDYFSYLFPAMWGLKDRSELALRFNFPFWTPYSFFRCIKLFKENKETASLLHLSYQDYSPAPYEITLN